MNVTLARYIAKHGHAPPRGGDPRYGDKDRDSIYYRRGPTPR